MADLQSAEPAAAWARDALAAKNTLTRVDAKIVEEAFEQKLMSFAVGDNRGTARRGRLSGANRPQIRQDGASGDAPDGDQPAGIDKSVLTVGTPRRYRNREHLRFVAQQPCLSAAASPRIRTTCASCSRARSAARSAMSSRSRSAAAITAQLIAPATSSLVEGSRHRSDQGRPQALEAHAAEGEPGTTFICLGAPKPNDGRTSEPPA